MLIYFILFIYIYIYVYICYILLSYFSFNLDHILALPVEFPIRFFIMDLVYVF